MKTLMTYMLKYTLYTLSDNGATDTHIICNSTHDSLSAQVLEWLYWMLSY